MIHYCTMSWLNKIFSKSDKVQSEVSSEKIAVVKSNPRLFIKNTSDVASARPLVNATSQLQFLDMTGRLGAYVGYIHSVSGKRGLILAVRDKEGNAIDEVFSLLTDGNRVTASAPTPDVKCRGNEIATTKYVVDMLFGSYRSVIVDVRDNEERSGVLEGLLPLSEYAVDVTYVCSSNNVAGGGLPVLYLGSGIRMEMAVADGLSVTTAFAVSDSDGVISWRITSPACMGKTIRIDARLKR